MLEIHLQFHHHKLPHLSFVIKLNLKVLSSPRDELKMATPFCEISLKKQPFHYDILRTFPQE